MFTIRLRLIGFDGAPHAGVAVECAPSPSPLPDSIADVVRSAAMQRLTDSEGRAEFTVASIPGVSYRLRSVGTSSLPTVVVPSQPSGSVVDAADYATIEPGKPLTDTDLILARVTALESRPGGGSSYDDTPLRALITTETGHRTDGDAALASRIDALPAPTPPYDDAEVRSLIAGKVDGTDARLSDAREPRPHRHNASEIDGLPSGGGSGSGLIGEGFPHTSTSAAVRDAPTGASYVDSAVTCGAMVWRKWQNGWRVVEGDTGWRRVADSTHPSGDIIAGYIAVRRVGPTIYAAARGGSWDTISIKEPSSSATLATLPAGMVPAANCYHPLTSGQAPSTFIYLGSAADGRAVQVRGSGGAYLSAETGGVLADASVAWPDTLPGVPA